jgi:hypothetical protein
MAASYTLINAAEQLVASTRKITEQSRKLIASTNAQIELSHQALSEEFKKPYVLKAFIEKNLLKVNDRNEQA